MTAPRLWTDRGSLRVLGMGAALPGAPLATAALLGIVEERFGVDVIRRGTAVARRLGIRARHISRAFAEPLEAPRPGQRNPELAALAVRRALDEAGLLPGDLAYLVGHTATPAMALPANVAEVASLLGYDGPFAEFRQACTGFVNALLFAQGLMRAGCGPVAVVGSETGSVHFDPRRAEEPGQLVNLVQMGDGAAAVVLARDSCDGGARLSNVFHGQVGTGQLPGLTIPAGGSDAAAVPHGFTGFEHRFDVVRDSGPDLLRRGAEAARDAGVGDADWTLPHQANGRMDALLAPLLGVARERVVVQADRVGNTGSAAIWLALEEHRARLRPGETVLALGAEATAHMYGGFLYQHG